MVTRQPSHPEPQGADADLPLDPIGFDHGLEGLAVSIGGGRWPYRSARPNRGKGFRRCNQLWASRTYAVPVAHPRLQRSPQPLDVVAESAISGSERAVSKQTATARSLLILCEAWRTRFEHPGRCEIRANLASPRCRVRRAVATTMHPSGEFISQITLPIRCVTNLRDV